MASTPGTPVLRTRSLLSVARKQLIVTGGAGQPGHALVRALNECGEENILIVDRLGTGDRWRNLQGLRFADLIDPATFMARVREDRAPTPSTLFNLFSTTSAEGADELVARNLGDARTLCEWCLKSGGRFIHASCASTYGDGSGGWFDTHENLPALRPPTAYSFSKHLFDLWALRGGALDKIAVVKLFDVYGPGDDESPVARMLREIRAGGVPTLREGATGEAARRDFVHAKDVAEFLLFLHEHPEACGMFNAGSGRARGLDELGALLFAALGLEPRTARMRSSDDETDGFQTFTQAELSKVRAAGFAAEFTPLEEGVSDFVKSQPPGASAPVRM